ncbi:hypothetical protein AYI70_g261 [Smittium culicis]|nr:hypothetical protein AYI70_g261 [Smittium culicis]
MKKNLDKDNEGDSKYLKKGVEKKEIDFLSALKDPIVYTKKPNKKEKSLSYKKKHKSSIAFSNYGNDLKSLKISAPLSGSNFTSKASVSQSRSKTSLIEQKFDPISLRKPKTDQLYSDIKPNSTLQPSKLTSNHGFNKTIENSYKNLLASQSSHPLRNPNPFAEDIAYDSSSVILEPPKFSISHDRASFDDFFEWDRVELDGIDDSSDEISVMSTRTNTDSKYFRSMRSYNPTRYIPYTNSLSTEKEDKLKDTSPDEHERLAINDVIDNNFLSILNNPEIKRDNINAYDSPRLSEDPSFTTMSSSYLPPKPTAINKAINHGIGDISKIIPKSESNTSSTRISSPSKEHFDNFPGKNKVTFDEKLINIINKNSADTPNESSFKRVTETKSVVDDSSIPKKSSSILYEINDSKESLSSQISVDSSSVNIFPSDPADKDEIVIEKNDEYNVFLSESFVNNNPSDSSEKINSILGFGYMANEDELSFNTKTKTEEAFKQSLESLTDPLFVSSSAIKDLVQSFLSDLRSQTTLIQDKVYFPKKAIISKKRSLPDNLSRPKFPLSLIPSRDLLNLDISISNIEQDNLDNSSATSINLFSLDDSKNSALESKVRKLKKQLNEIKKSLKVGFENEKYKLNFLTQNILNLIEVNDSLSSDIIAESNSIAPKLKNLISSLISLNNDKITNEIDLKDNINQDNLATLELEFNSGLKKIYSSSENSLNEEKDFSIIPHQLNKINSCIELIAKYCISEIDALINENKFLKNQSKVFKNNELNEIKTNKHDYNDINSNESEVLAGNETETETINVPSLSTKASSEKESDTLLLKDEISSLKKLMIEILPYSKIPKDRFSEENKNLICKIISESSGLITPNEEISSFDFTSIDTSLEVEKSNESSNSGNSDNSLMIPVESGIKSADSLKSSSIEFTPLENDVFVVKTPNNDLDDLTVQHDRVVKSYETQLKEYKNILKSNQEKSAILENNLLLLQSEYLKSKSMLEDTNNSLRNEIRVYKKIEKELKSNILKLKLSIFDLRSDHSNIVSSNDLNTNDNSNTGTLERFSNNGDIRRSYSLNRLNKINSIDDFTNKKTSSDSYNNIDQVPKSKLSDLNRSSSIASYHSSYRSKSIKKYVDKFQNSAIYESAVSDKSIIDLDGLNNDLALIDLKKKNINLSNELKKIKESYNLYKSEANFTKNSLVDRIESLLINIDNVKSKSISSDVFEQFRASWESRLDEREELVNNYKMDINLSKIKIVEVIKLILISSDSKPMTKDGAQIGKPDSQSIISELYHKLANSSSVNNDYETLLELFSNISLRVNPKGTTTSKTPVVKAHQSLIRSNSRKKHKFRLLSTSDFRFFNTNSTKNTDDEAIKFIETRLMILNIDDLIKILVLVIKNVLLEIMPYEYSEYVLSSHPSIVLNNFKIGSILYEKLISFNPHINPSDDRSKVLINVKEYNDLVNKVSDAAIINKLVMAQLDATKLSIANLRKSL